MANHLIHQANDTHTAVLALLDDSPTGRAFHAIAELHAPTEGDSDAPVCSSCGCAGEYQSYERLFPCATYRITAGMAGIDLDDPEPSPVPVRTPERDAFITRLRVAAGEVR